MGEEDDEAMGRDLDGFLDEAIGTLGGMLGEMGYAMPERMPAPLEVPSGELLVCDIAALPPPRAPLGRLVAGGKARGGVFPFGETVTPGIPDAIPGSVSDIVLLERQARAERERTRIVTSPVTGVYLIGDATLLAGVKRAPRRVPRVAETFGALETVTRVAREAGARLGPTPMALLLQTARTGLWRGVIHGRDALAVSLGSRHALRIREGIDERGDRVYLRIDALRDGVMADPRLRAMAKAK